MRKTEINAYYKMLRAFLVLNSISQSPTAIKIPIVKFLDGFHKLWNKYYAKEFKEKI